MKQKTNKVIYSRMKKTLSFFAVLSVIIVTGMLAGCKGGQGVGDGARSIVAQRLGEVAVEFVGEILFAAFRLMSVGFFGG